MPNASTPSSRRILRKPYRSPERVDVCDGEAVSLDDVVHGFVGHGPKG